jgi:hypothetical protein
MLNPGAAIPPGVAILPGAATLKNKTKFFSLLHKPFLSIQFMLTGSNLVPALASKL